MALLGPKREAEAQAFASVFLLPEGSVRAALNGRPLMAPNMHQLVRLKHHWGVSVALLAHRLHSLGMISDYYYRGICIEISKYGRHREAEEIERESSQVLQKVFNDLRTSGVTRAEIAAALDLYPEDVDALIFGLGGVIHAASGKKTDDPDADERRKTFKIV